MLLQLLIIPWWYVILYRKRSKRCQVKSRDVVKEAKKHVVLKINTTFCFFFPMAERKTKSYQERLEWDEEALKIYNAGKTAKPK